MRILFAFPAPKGDPSSLFYHGDFVSAASLGSCIKNYLKSEITTLGPKGLADIEYEVKPFSKRHIHDTFKHIIKLQDEYDLIHYHVGGWSALNYFKYIKKPLVLTVHDPPTSGLEFSYYGRDKLIESLNSQVIRVVYPSKYSKIKFLERLNFDYAASITTYIHHGIDICKEVCDYEKVNDFISVGRMDVLKNFHLLSDLLKDRLTVVAGRNIHGKKPESLWIDCFKKNSTKHVYPVPKNELYTLYKKHKAYVSLSKVETFGFTAVESAMVGTLPIVTSEGGLGEIANVLGIPTIYTSNRSKKTIKKQILDIYEYFSSLSLTDKYKITELVHSIFDVNVEGKSYISLYKTILGV